MIANGNFPWGHYDALLASNARLQSELSEQKQKLLEEVVIRLNSAYHPQNPASMHPADFIIKSFELVGHENLEFK
jgi:hypothetical protein